MNMFSGKTDCERDVPGTISAARKERRGSREFVQADRHDNRRREMVFRMLTVLSEFERDQVAERTKCALSHLRKRISRKIPFGFDQAEDGVSLVPGVRRAATGDRRDVAA